MHESAINDIIVKKYPNIQSYEKRRHTMNNPIKKYFNKIYSETGKKPFTFLNCFLVVLLPLIFIFGSAFLIADTEEVVVPATIIGLVVSLGLNLVLLIVKFKGKAIGLFFLTVLASILFFCSFILWPILKFAFRAGSAATQANLGNTTASVNASRRAGATKGKKSALNWFEYDGYVWKDEKEIMPEDLPNGSLDEGAYSYDQNQSARNVGYANAKDAEMSGRKWDGNNWV